MLIKADQKIIVSPGFTERREFPGTEWEEAIKSFVLLAMTYPVGHHRPLGTKILPYASLQFPNLSIELNTFGPHRYFLLFRGLEETPYKSVRGVAPEDYVSCTCERRDTDWCLLAFASDTNLSHLEIKDPRNKKSVLFLRRFDAQMQLEVHCNKGYDM